MSDREGAVLRLNTLGPASKSVLLPAGTLLFVIPAYLLGSARTINRKISQQSLD